MQGLVPNCVRRTIGKMSLGKADKRLGVAKSGIGFIAGTTALYSLFLAAMPF